MQATLERLRERREQRGDEGGFTLIELLIVIVILGILAAIVVFAVQNLTGSASKSSCGADYKTTETAAEAYKAQEGVVAPDMPALTTQAADGNGPWLKEVPGNPGHYAIGVSAGNVGVGADQAAANAAAAAATGNTCATVAK